MNRVFWGVIILLFLLTRIPAMPQYFSIDNVNLALSLEKFDPRAHQPQPPGYPLFVVFNRMANVLFRDPATTFAVTGLLVSVLCLPLVCAVGSRLFALWVGRAAALMLVVAPPFWYASLEGPLRPHLALFSLLTAYCCWRCWNGEKTFAIWGAITLAIGAGFRPDLGGYLFPLWLLSAWMGTRSLTAVIKGIVVMAAVVFAWVGGMAYVVGGLGELYRLNVDYVAFQSTGQTVSRQISRLTVWNASAILGATVALPLFLKVKDRVGLLSSQSVFLLAWLLPGLLFQAFVHIEDPGHTLFSIPALCLAGAYVIFAGTQHMVETREVFLGVTLVISSMLFLGLFSLPAAAAPAGGHSLKNAFLFGIFETSLGELRYQDNTAIQTMAEFREFARKDIPTVIVSSDIDSATWFMNWRIARYYVPNIDIWVVGELNTPHFVQHVRRDRMLESERSGDLKVPLPRVGRVIWLTEREGPLHRALKQTLKDLPGGAYLSYTDITPDMAPFHVMGFDFIPGEQ